MLVSWLGGALSNFTRNSSESHGSGDTVAFLPTYMPFRIIIRSPGVTEAIIRPLQNGHPPSAPVSVKWIRALRILGSFRLSSISRVLPLLNPPPQPRPEPPPSINVGLFNPAPALAPARIVDCQQIPRML